MKNLIYFGDNLKVMNSSDFSANIGKIGMIYIDPPYNTATAKSYNDTFSDDEWNVFMSQRLTIAEKLLKDDGVIFISIDDNQYAELKIICDKVFKKTNYIGTFITHQAQRSNAKLINTVHEYILCYAKDKKKIKEFSISRMDIPEDKEMITFLQNKIKAEFNKSGKFSAEKLLKTEIKKICLDKNITWIKNYNCIDDNGNIFFGIDLSTPSSPRVVDIPEINLHLEPLKNRGWVSDKTFIELYKNGRIAYKGNRPYKIKYLTEAEDSVPSILNFYSRQGTEDLKRLGLNGLFDTPKPVEMIKFIIRIAHKENDTILDFFGGSGTTAQAVYETNIEDGRNNNYILIQLEEELDKKSQARKIAEKLEIKPVISEILKLRIDTFLKARDLEKDYQLIKIDS